MCRGGDSGYTGQRMLEIKLPGMRKRGRQQRRLMNRVKEDLQRVVVRRMLGIG